MRHNAWSFVGNLRKMVICIDMRVEQCFGKLQYLSVYSTASLFEMLRLQRCSTSSCFLDDVDDVGRWRVWVNVNDFLK